MTPPSPLPKTPAARPAPAPTHANTAVQTPVPEQALAYMQLLGSVLTALEASDGGGVPLPFDEGMQAAAQMLADAAKADGKVLLVGNGGSAAIVSHIQNDLCKAARIPAMVFNEPALLTAFANDDGYEVAFQKIAEIWARPADVLIAVSSSGRSPNIIGTVNACQARGCKTITLSGFSDDNPLRKMGDLNFFARAQSYGMVELAHGCIGHYFSDRVTQLLAAPPRRPSITVLPLEASRG